MNFTGGKYTENINLIYNTLGFSARFNIALGNKILHEFSVTVLIQGSYSNPL